MKRGRSLDSLLRFSLRGRIVVGEPLSDCSTDKVSHALAVIHLAGVVLELGLGDVPVQVFP